MGRYSPFVLSHELPKNMPRLFWVNGISRYLRAGRFENRPLGIVFALLILILSKLIQPVSPNSAFLTLGIHSFVSEEQLSNASGLILSIPAGISVFKFLHPEKAEEPSVFKQCGRLMVANCSQPLKVPSSIENIESGNVTLHSFLQFRKANAPILLTLWGISISDMPVPENALRLIL